MEYRAWVRHDKGPFNPSTPGKRFLSETLTSFINNSEVIDALKLIFPWISDAVKPSIPFSSRKPLTMPSSSLAQTTATSATVPLVIHILDPLIIQSSPSFTALVAIPPGSDPWFDSVKPKQPTASPDASLGSHLSFCSSVPYWKIGYITRPPWTLQTDLKPESPFSNSCIIKP